MSADAERDEAAGTEASGVGALAGEPTSAAVPGSAGAARKAGRRELTVTVLIGLLGGIIAWAAAGRTWATATVGELPNTVKVAASGGNLSGALTALALTGLAGALALLATQRLARRLVGVLLVAAGVGLAVYAFGERGSAHAARVLATKAAAKGVAAGSLSVHTASWWLAALFGGVLVVLAGAAALVRGASWPGMSSRYENAASKTAARAADTGSSKDLWDALDRGEDPTDAAESAPPAEIAAATGSAGALTPTPRADH